MFEVVELLLVLFDAFDEDGDEDAVALLLFVLLLFVPELEDPEDPPDDCFSFLSLIIMFSFNCTKLLNRDFLFNVVKNVHTSSHHYKLTQEVVEEKNICSFFSS